MGSESEPTPTQPDSQHAGAGTAQFASVFVESVKLSNLRGISDLTLELQPHLTLLVGRNNSGKTRILHAIAIALGALPADQDDFTVGTAGDAHVDVVVAPSPPSFPGTGSGDAEFEQSFPDTIGQVLNPDMIRDQPLSERFAWRTTIRRSAEGVGARADRYRLNYSAHQGWYLPSSPHILSRDQLGLFEGTLIGARRDLSDELSMRGSPIRRILNDLELDEAARTQLENELQKLGNRIVTQSNSLEAVNQALQSAEHRIDGFGSPEFNALPTRLEELARSISLDLDTGTGALPLRLHGSGPRSLASLLVQTVLYERRLGRDGPSTPRHPITLVEEPEAHLHPQMQLELPSLLDSVPGQVIVSTHSSHLVTTVDPRALRLTRTEAGRSSVVDLRPAASADEATHRARQPALFEQEMEKLKRLVERPFGELLFASAVIIGDGATERSFLPPLLRYGLGSVANGVCVIDPGSMTGPLAHAAIKFARLVEVPWYLFCDSDESGDAAAEKLCHEHGEADHLGNPRRVTVSAQGEGATEKMMVDFDTDLARQACLNVRPDYDETAETWELLKKLKGSTGPFLADQLVKKYPAPADWPGPLQQLLQILRDGLAPHSSSDTE